jgi:hypothetical protein
MSSFEELAALDVSKHTEQKGRFTYLSWAWAHDYMARKDPDFTWEVHDFADAQGVLAPYMANIAGCFVRVTVQYRGQNRTHTMPVLDHKNKPVSATDVSSFDVNTTMMRTFVKCCALHGLGLYIYAGEDLPQEPELPDLADMNASDVLITFGKYKSMGLTLGEVATQGGYLGKAYLKHGASNHKNPVMREKLAEVWKLHSDPMTDDEITEALQDVPDVKALKALLTLLTDQQKVDHMDTLDAVEGDLA